MEEVKTLAMLQELSEKIDTMIDLLRNIESNTSSTESNTDDIFYAKSELQDINTNLQKVLNKIE